MNEFERLREFYPFDDEVLARVERAARWQEGTTWPEYQRRFDIPEPTVFQPKDGKPIEVVDLNSSRGEHVIVYHQPMACILDPNIMTHVATLAAAQAEHRIIAVGNPGQPGRGYGKLSVADAIKVWRGDLRPAVAPTLEYLNSQGIEAAYHIGESYGADKSLASAENATDYDSQAISSIMVEPVSVAKIGILKMGLKFQSTGKHAEEYLEPVREASDAFVSAETLRYKPYLYPVGLIGRISNLAVAKALASGGFESRADRALTAEPNLTTGIAWGTASEFDTDNERERIVTRLQGKHGEGRVTAMPLDGQTHAMNLDIFLNAAIYSQLLKEAA